jgi:hypothetical protein
LKHSGRQAQYGRKMSVRGNSSEFNPPASSSRSSIRRYAASSGSSPRISSMKRSASSRRDEDVEGVAERRSRRPRGPCLRASFDPLRHVARFPPQDERVFVLRFDAKSTRLGTLTAAGEGCFRCEGHGFAVLCFARGLSWRCRLSRGRFTLLRQRAMTSHPSLAPRRPRLLLAQRHRRPTAKLHGARTRNKCVLGEERIFGRTQARD